MSRMMLLTQRVALLKLVFVTMIALVMLTSCIGPKTTGYRLFRGNSEGLQVSFEYPEHWKQGNIKKYGTYNTVGLDAKSANISVTISSNINAVRGAFGNAEELIERTVAMFSGTPDFQVISRGNVSFVSGEWQEVIISYRLKNYGLDPHAPVGYVVDKVLVIRDLAIAHEARVYEIMLMTDYDNYEKANLDFEHLLTTFRFLE